MRKTIGEIFETSDYSMFRITEWNRSVSDQRATKIRDSIEQNGYVLNPICVNEKYEVIDGQGRLEALKTLGLPVHFYIAAGASREECIALNRYNTLWTVYDYICSHASSGSDDYIRIKELLDLYGKSFGMDTVIFAATGLVKTPRTQIQRGRFKCSAEQYADGMTRLTDLKEFEVGVSKMPGNQKKVYQAILFALGCAEEEIDPTKLRERIELQYSKSPTVSSLNDALRAISTIYNTRSHRTPVHLDVAYEKFMCGKYLWYEDHYKKAT